MRIPAETYVLVWDHLASMLEVENTGGSGAGACGNCNKKNPISNVDPFPGGELARWSLVSEEYLREANLFIRSKCDETAVSFVYLPRPPSNPDLHPTYLQCLDRLTLGLPPTLLVHGVSPVMTTTL